VSVLSVRVGAIMPGRNPESCFSSTIARKPYARMPGHGPYPPGQPGHCCRIGFGCRSLSLFTGDGFVTPTLESAGAMEGS